MSKLDKDKDENLLNNKLEQNNNTPNKEKSGFVEQIIKNIIETNNEEKKPIEKKEKYKGFIKPTKKITKLPLFYIFLFLLFILFGIIVHIIKPASTFFSIFLLTRFVKTKKNEIIDFNAKGLNKGVKTVGWLIIFLLPLVHIITKGHMIILIQKNCFLKFYVTILLLIELYFQFPLTFLYENNLHSIFLWGQKGIEQLLSPWIIFFPTDFLIDWFEIIRQLFDSIFFFSATLKLYIDIKNNKYQAFTLYFMILSMVFYWIRIIFAIGMLFVKIIVGNSSLREKKKRKIYLENERDNQEEEKKEEKNK